MGWKQYFLAGLLLNVAMMVIGFLILVFQGNLPLNPMGFAGIKPRSRLHASSLVCNKHGPAALQRRSNLLLSEPNKCFTMASITSAITGLCMGIAFIRGFIVGSKDMGNFYVDFTRSITRIFLPLCHYCLNNISLL